MKRPNPRKIAKLIRRHLTLNARAIALFQEAGETLDALLALNPPIGEPIQVGDRLAPDRRVMITDQFAGRNTAFSAKAFHRFQVKDFKMPRPPKASKEPEPVAQPESEETAAI